MMATCNQLKKKCIFAWSPLYQKKVRCVIIIEAVLDVSYDFDFKSWSAQGMTLRNMKNIQKNDSYLFSCAFWRIFITSWKRTRRVDRRKQRFHFGYCGSAGSEEEWPVRKRRKNTWVSTRFYAVFPPYTTAKITFSGKSGQNLRRNSLNALSYFLFKLIDHFNFWNSKLIIPMSVSFAEVLSNKSTTKRAQLLHELK